jgi:hypothetical protein
VIRCDGETISEKKTYSGKRVLELLDISYQNGYRRGTEEACAKLTIVENAAYRKGYQNGHDNAVDEIAQLKSALLGILGMGGV